MSGPVALLLLLLAWEVGKCALYTEVFKQLLRLMTCERVLRGKALQLLLIGGNWETHAKQNDDKERERLICSKVVVVATRSLLTTPVW